MSIFQCLNYESHTYDANPSTLNKFLSNCDFVINKYCYTDTIFWNYLIKVIHSKLTVHATVLVGGRAELSTWPIIKAGLHQSFGDKRSLECLEQLRTST